MSPNFVLAALLLPSAFAQSGNPRLRCIEEVRENYQRTVNQRVRACESTVRADLGEALPRLRRHRDAGAQGIHQALQATPPSAVGMEALQQDGVIFGSHSIVMEHSASGGYTACGLCRSSYSLQNPVFVAQGQGPIEDYLGVRVCYQVDRGLRMGADRPQHSVEIPLVCNDDQEPNAPRERCWGVQDNDATMPRLVEWRMESLCSGRAPAAARKHR